MSPSETSSGMYAPVSWLRLPGPTARTVPRCGFSCAVSGKTMPPIVVCSSSRASTISRSPSGFRFILRPPLCDRLVTLIGTLGRRVPARLAYRIEDASRVLRGGCARAPAARALVRRRDPAGREAGGPVGPAEGADRQGRVRRGGRASGGRRGDGRARALARQARRHSLLVQLEGRAGLQGRVVLPRPLRERPA